MVASCIGCGVTYQHSCFPDRWLRVDYSVFAGVCSKCEGFIGAWDAGVRVRRFRPVNGRLAFMFIGRWCGNCQQGNWLRKIDSEDCCDILGRTMTCGVDDPKYPSEWRYDALGGYPACMAYIPNNPLAHEKHDTGKALA